MGTGRLNNTSGSGQERSQDATHSFTRNMRYEAGRDSILAVTYLRKWRWQDVLITKYAPAEGEQDVASLARGDVIKYMILCATNAAGAINGMAQEYERSIAEIDKVDDKPRRKRVGLTMFGVTTPCVDKIRQHLEANYNIECFVFHCTGAGGRAMERLVSEGVLEAVLDVTTTEICDQICGGAMDAGPQRLEAPLKAGIPYLVSVGATDMVNFGPKATVPERYQGRKLFEHNPTVTLMRTSPEECAAIGNFIVDKIKRLASKRGTVQVVLPVGGVSMIATPGGPFHDAEADDALFSAIKTGLKDTGISVIEDQRAVNDEGFAVDVAERLVATMGMRQ